jgi:uncharacterized membrane protein
MNRRPMPAVTTAALSENQAAALSYALGMITGIAFLLLPPYSGSLRIRFNAMQSMLFTAGLVALSVVVNIVGAILPSILTHLVMMLFCLVALCSMGTWVYLMWKNSQGETVMLPMIGPAARRMANP